MLPRWDSFIVEDFCRTPYFTFVRYANFSIANFANLPV